MRLPRASLGRRAPQGWPDVTPGMGTTHVRLAVADCLREPDPGKRHLDSILARLWRETPEAVIDAYDAVIFGTLDSPSGDIGGRHGLLAARMRELRRPLPRRDKVGMQLRQIADQADMDRETLARLMERHGLLELVPYGGRQRRRLVTDAAFRDGLGHNVDPGHIRSPRLDGNARAAVFPVLYSDKLPAIPGKRERMRWLLSHHAYLPDQALADVGGYSLRGVEKARSLIVLVTTAAA